MNDEKTDFSIATNFDDELLPRLAEYGVTEIYGSVTGTPGGTGRPESALPDVRFDRAAAHIDRAHSHGLRFVLLLNAACTGNIEFLQSEKRAIRSVIDFAKQVGVEAITVANPLFLEAVRQDAPGVQCKISVHAEADTISRIRWWLERGADIVTLPSRRNRDFAFLRRIGSIFGSSVELLANNLCLAHCPLDRYHGQIVAHASISGFGACDICLVWCNLEKLRRPYAFLSSPWIRPEDVSVYENIGFRRFKLTDRCKTTVWVSEVARAYSSRRSPDNLMSILNAPHPEGEDDRVNKSAAAWCMPRVSIRTEALGGFLEPFLTNQCDGDCQPDRCTHCKDYADAALDFDRTEVEEANQHLKRLCDSAILR